MSRSSTAQVSPREQPPSLSGCGAGQYGPPYDIEVPHSGYAWWYVDGVSADGELGITVIAFVGTVFSTRYALARRSAGLVDPLDFCAVNVVVYRPGGKLWSFTEWPREAVRRSKRRLEIGTSAVGWSGSDLVVAFDERCAPFGGALRGRLRLTPTRRFAEPFTLDQRSRHRWCPIAPLAKIEVELEQPALSFCGSGYHDANWGDEPLEAAFVRWNWSRAELSKGAAVLYDVERREGGPLSIGKLFTPGGKVQSLDAPLQHALPDGRWGEPRATRTDVGGRAEVRRTLETSPFYARSLLRTDLAGEEAVAMHEALSLERFSKLWVQLLLPFRMRNRHRWPW